ncbi:glycosyl transferase [Flavobacterium noncentrifugens]|uniref:Glycosyltransferase involved in cell wall bisynthesis n=1 Tax=Flavobacterium noncentrifugens TaxID=1128970 RepID=A0A1G8V985_9FLAO|nr:glycosyltransferase family A protein [Flavobacterium noncentrifugens]GEP50399.1 glycosyl transferase [Flavobacterium noncentrifugens]SDJ62652.1 Glycosyltransferase involved in cell wall bisynthesis [Flavobacterium noncentrifugens]
MTAPKISVIVPCYNQAQYLDQALQSVEAQSCSDWECIIVDDGSSDHIDEVAIKWTAKSPKFKYVKKTNGGLASARNFGIENSTGTYIFPLDADDYVATDYFARAIEILDAQDDVEVLHCNVMQFGYIQKPLTLLPYHFETLLIKNCIIACAFFRRETFLKAGGYSEALQILEDWDLWLTILQHGGKVHKIDAYLYYYRKHEQGSLVNSFEKDKKRHKEHLNIIYKNHVDLYLAHFGNPIKLYKELKVLRAFHKKSTSTVMYKIYKLPNRLKKLFKSKK